MIRRQRGILRKLCCFLSPQTLEAPESVWNDQKGLTTEIGTTEAIPLAERTIAALSSTAGITAEETKLITTMSEGFAKWYAEGQSVSANVDEISSLLLEASKNQPDWVKISAATTKLYGLNSKETSALRTWAQYYYIWPDFEPAITKLPAATGLVIRSTDLEASTVSDHQKSSRDNLELVSSLIYVTKKTGAELLQTLSSAKEWEILTVFRSLC